MDKQFGIGPSQGGDDTSAVDVTSDGFRMFNCTLQARHRAIRVQMGAKDAVIANCTLRGAAEGVMIQDAHDIRFVECNIVGSSDFGQPQGGTSFVGVRVEQRASTDPSNVVFTSCDIRGVSKVATKDAYGVLVEDDTAGGTSFVDCRIEGSQSFAPISQDTAQAFGVAATLADSVRIFGGAISAVDGDERETDSYPVKNLSTASPAALPISTSLAKYGNWLGPIAATKQASTTQVAIDILAESSAAVIVAAMDPMVEKTVVTGFTQPDVPRVLSALASASSSQEIILIGTDFVGDRIADKITLDGTTIVDGTKVFRRIDKLVLPPGNVTVSIGTTSKIGLQSPISSDDDVGLQARKASAATAFTFEAVDSRNSIVGWIDVDDITDDDSFQWAINGGQ